MLIHTPHKPRRTHLEDPDDAEPGLLPVDPDEGAVPPAIPGDPEHDRIIDPEA